MRGQRHLLTALLLVASVAILAPAAGATSDLDARRSGTVRSQHELALRAALASLAAGAVASRLRSPDPQGAMAVDRSVAPGAPSAVRSGDAGFSRRDAGLGAGAAFLAIAVCASAFLGIRHMRRRVVSPATSKSYFDRKDRPV
ncbi:MAG: hypothetical protein C5B48_05105 [Candidatus Rokuibacteriota bacterium]|nr:MAG: hypothetical protein C5B48_05105 [Candidatus Rokubacteria bacterium]